ncbi:MBL fold metallo-hydrolase [Methanobacterium sp.]|uniref:MBL fold metallo-hydrolase n=1 Tax=Methanobacterium sp. TaxID=2164 RepID=UPI003C74A703
MKREAFNFKKHYFKEWNEVFDNPQQITVKSFITGQVLLNKRGALNPDHPKAGAINNELLEVPVLAHWIHHEKLGDYLIDTGLDSSYHNDPHGNMKGILAKLFIKTNLFVDEYKQAKNQNISYHIKKNRIKLNGVFFTHLHSDHIAGTRELPKNITYVTGKEEKYHDHKPFFYGDYLKGVKTLYEIDFEDTVDMPVLGKCIDIFGDESFWAISTPGHTKGHISFLVNSIEGPILLTGDVCFIKSSFKNGVAPSSYTEDVRVNQKSFDKIFEFKMVYPKIKVICGHEIS